MEKRNKRKSEVRLVWFFVCFYVRIVYLRKRERAGPVPLYFFFSLSFVVLFLANSTSKNLIDNTKTKNVVSYNTNPTGRPPLFLLTSSNDTTKQW